MFQEGLGYRFLALAEHCVCRRLFCFMLLSPGCSPGLGLLIPFQKAALPCLPWLRNWVGLTVMAATCEAHLSGHSTLGSPLPTPHLIPLPRPDLYHGNYLASEISILKEE